MSDKPTTVTGVEAYLRSLLPPNVSAVLLSEGGSEYPFLFGMATVKLAEANAEIMRLQKQIAEARAIAKEVEDML